MQTTKDTFFNQLTLAVKITLFLMSLTFFLSLTLSASDHIDFPGGIENNTVPRELDLTDLFAWVPSPGKLTIALNTNLAASSRTRFSETNSYRFRIRKTSVLSSKNSPLQIPMLSQNSSEFIINCKVSEEIATCSYKNFSASAIVNDIDLADTDTTNGFKLFAGLRADPFILDIDWASKYTQLSAAAELPVESKPLPLSEPKNFSDYLNVLNLTIEMDTAQIFGEQTEFLAIAADVGHETASGFKIIDRVGRPELTNMTIRAPEIKNRYNTADTYALSESDALSFLAYIGAGITGWDRLDGKKDWTLVAMEDFKQILVNDFLVVNTKGICSFKEASYLDIELNKRVNSGNFKSCGGRTPNEDIIDTLVSYYVGGYNESIISYGDGVGKIRKPPTAVWPYFSHPFTLWPFL